MAIRPNYSYNTNVYIHMSTTNQSFLDMHYYLKDRGIKNHDFFLVLLDPDLASINPRDPKLNSFMKQKILRECLFNYWYFLREIVRIPDQGGQVGSGVKYQLHRGNLAMNFGFVRNWNMFVEFPRQNFKTISALCRKLWVFNFGTSNSEMMFINKKHDDSKENLARFKELREALPSYLRMDQQYGKDGKKLKVKNSIETLEHPTNGNSIRTMASARNKVSANSLGRGLTQPLQWYDEYAFIPYVGIIYQSATPAFKTASMNAARNNSPYGILITTTPGDLTTDEGLEAYYTKDDATKFDETFYDKSDMQLKELLSKNENSSFVYIRYTYQQLGRDEKWFKDICILMKKNWSAIRREVLLEWSKASDNSPFKKEDLNIVKGLLREPIRTITICNYYQFEIYEQINLRYPPIIGVDVSGGFKRDSSAITIIDSKTTKVFATFNCNYISTDDLARVIYELVTKYMPNAVVNIERNGGFGSSVLSKLMKTNIKKNLYYEIKDRVVEERFTNGISTKAKQRTKVYGLDSTKSIRDLLMEILRERMEYHKDKFVSPILYRELEGLEVKRNGKIEHSNNTHDDQVFSYLLGLYVWYEGNNLMELYGIDKTNIKSDSILDGAISDISEQFTDIVSEMEMSDNELVKSQLDLLGSTKIKTHAQFIEDQYNEEQEAIDKILSSPVGAKAYAEKFNLDSDSIAQRGASKLPDEIFSDFYD